WGEPHGRPSATRHFRRKDSQGRKAGRSAGPATDQVRAGDQPQNRQGAWPDGAAVAVAARRRGHRINTERSCSDRWRGTAAKLVAAGETFADYWGRQCLVGLSEAAETLRCAEPKIFRGRDKPGD